MLTERLIEVGEIGGGWPQLDRERGSPVVLKSLQVLGGIHDSGIEETVACFLWHAHDGSWFTTVQKHRRLDGNYGHE